MAFKKYAKKGAKKAYAYAKKRYVKKTAAGSVRAVVRDVARLKAVLNPEQKRFQLTVTDKVVAQCSQNASSQWTQNITPLIPEGITGSTRNGNSVKISSLRFRFQIRGQSAQLAPIKFKYWIYGCKGQPFSSTAQANSNLLDTNVFTGLYDFNSDRNEDAKATVRVFKFGTMYLKGAAVTNGAAPIATAPSISDYVIMLRMKNHHIKYDSDTTNPFSGNIYMTIVADSGNCSTANVSTLGNIPVLAINTGSIFCMDLTTHFYDN